MANDLDLDDLQKLLSNLDKPENTESASVTEPVESVDESVISDINNIIDSVTAQDVLGLKPSTPITPITDAIVPLETQREPDSSFEFKKYLDKLDITTDEVLQACRSDRQDAMDTISTLRRIIDDTPPDRRPSGEILGCLVKAIEVRANINMAAVKMMEANAKMLAAVKPKTGVVNNNIMGNMDLGSILSEPLSDQDIY